MAQAAPGSVLYISCAPVHGLLKLTVVSSRVMFVPCSSWDWHVCYVGAMCVPCICCECAMCVSCVCHVGAMWMPCMCHECVERVPRVCHVNAMYAPSYGIVWQVSCKGQ